MSDSFKKLILSQKTVFDTKDLAILWGITNKDSLKSKIYYWNRTGKLIRLTTGIYSISENYNKYECAAKILAPSYVSLETVMRENGCIFQYSTKITSVSFLRRNFSCAGNEYEYYKIKDAVLYNKEGIDFLQYYAIASLERAFLDMIYLNKEYYFDRLDNINWEKCINLVKIYKNNKLCERLIEYKKLYAG
jgi:hypothetical protein